MAEKTVADAPVKKVVQDVVAGIAAKFRTDEIPKNRSKNNQQTIFLQELTKDVKKANAEDIKDNNYRKRQFDRQTKELEEQKKLLNEAGKLDKSTEKAINDDLVKIDKKRFQMELKTSSPSKRKEMIKEQAAKDKRQLTATQRIGVAFDEFGDDIKNFKGADSSFLKGAALFGLFFLIPKVLNSKFFMDTIKFIEEKVIPFLGKIKDFFVNTFGEESLLAVGLASIILILKPGLIIKPLMFAVKGLRLAFIAVRFLISNKLTRGLLSLTKGALLKGFMLALKALKLAFLAIKGFMMTTLVPAIMATLSGLMSAIAPLLVAAAPIIAIGLAIAALIGALVLAFDEFKATLEDTGSITEAFKSGISKFIATLISLPAILFTQLIKFALKLFGFDEAAEGIPSPMEFIDIVTQGIMDAINFVADIFRSIIKFVKDKAKSLLGFLGFGKKEEDMTEEELNEQKTEQLLDEQKDETRRRTRLASKLSREQRQLQRDTKAAQKAYDKGEITAEELESVKAMEKSGIKAMAENRFFLEKSKETEDALKADLKSENYRIARGEGEFGQGDMSGATKTAALKAQEARIDKINDQMLEKYGYQTNQQGAPVIINNDASVRSNSSSYGVVNESITPRDGLLVSATADF